MTNFSISFRSNVKGRETSNDFNRLFVNAIKMIKICVILLYLLFVIQFITIVIIIVIIVSSSITIIILIKQKSYCQHIFWTKERKPYVKHNLEIYSTRKNFLAI